MGAVFAKLFWSAGLLLTAVSGTLNSYSYAGPGSPIMGQQMGSITVLDNVRLELDVVFHSTPTEWSGVWRVGDSDTNTRLPILLYDGQRLAIRTSTNVHNFDEFFWNVEVGHTYHVLMELVDGVYYAELDGIGQSPKQPRTLKYSGEFPVWFSDGSAADCTVSNLVYETWDVRPLTVTWMATSIILNTQSITLKPKVTKKPVTTTKPTTTTIKASSTTLKPTTTKPMSTWTPTQTDPITSTLLSTTPLRKTTTTSPTWWVSTGSAEPTVAFQKDPNEDGGIGLLYIAIGGAVFSVFLYVLLTIWRLSKNRMDPTHNAKTDTKHALDRVLSVSVHAIDRVPEVVVVEKKPEHVGAFVPGSRRVSNLMRTGAVQLSGMQPMQKQRPSLLLSSNGSVLQPASGRRMPGLPRPPPRAGAVFPPPKAKETRDSNWHTLGGEVYGEDEGYDGDGDGEVTVEGVQLGALCVESAVEFKSILMQLKLDARTAAEKKTTKMLDLAFTAEPKVMADEFQALAQMGFDTVRINELLRDKAENILLAKGISVADIVPTQRLHEGDTGDDKREDSEEMYEVVTKGCGKTHGATAMGAHSLEAFIAKKQLAARSGEQTAVARKLRIALTTAPCKMEAEFRELLRMGANSDEIVLSLAETANGILGRHQTI